jgi:hypothetical protein
MRRLTIFRFLTDNPNLIYAILRSHRRFEKLANFTLASALEEMHEQGSDSLEKDALQRINSNGSGSLSLSDATADEKTALAEAESRAASLSLTDTADSTATYPPQPHVKSEKAKGKMKEGSLVHSRSGSLERTATGHRWVSKSGFIPTESWVASWREGYVILASFILWARR